MLPQWHYNCPHKCRGSTHGVAAFRKFGLRIDVICKVRFNDARRTKQVDVKIPNLATADSPVGATEYSGDQIEVDAGKGNLRGRRKKLKH